MIDVGLHSIQLNLILYLYRGTHIILISIYCVKAQNFSYRYAISIIYYLFCRCTSKKRSLNGTTNN